MWNINLTPKFKYSRWVIYPMVLAVLWPLWQSSAFSRSYHNGFELQDPLIPATEILHGGPPKDGIPSLDKPSYIDASEMNQLKPNDRVLGIIYKGEARAYPIRILNYHELVNDEIAGDKILISFCPLCGTGMAFHAEIDGSELEFGVSGLLYNSDVLMYDRQTESLWSQIQAKAISGQFKGTQLKQIPIEHTTWEHWQKHLPDSQVLSFDTGHSRNYQGTPYVGYEHSERIYFPVSHEDKRYHPKELVVGVINAKQAKAYPFSELDKTKSPLVDRFGNTQIKIHFDAKARSAKVTDMNDKAINSLTAFWFAWYAFHPETEVFEVDESR